MLNYILWIVIFLAVVYKFAPEYLNYAIGASVLFLLVAKSREGFQLFEPRYGLRGELLRTRDIRGNYIGPKNYYRVNDSGGYQFVSDRPPFASEGDCAETKCPQYLEGHADECYDCVVNPNMLNKPM